MQLRRKLLIEFIRSRFPPFTLQHGREPSTLLELLQGVLSTEGSNLSNVPDACTVLLDYLVAAGIPKSFLVAGRNNKVHANATKKEMPTKVGNFFVSTLTYTCVYLWSRI